MNFVAKVEVICSVVLPIGRSSMMSAPMLAIRYGALQSFWNSEEKKSSYVPYDSA